MRRALADLPAELRRPETLEQMAGAAALLRAALPGASVEIYRHKITDEITLRVDRGERIYVKLEATAW